MKNRKNLLASTIAFFVGAGGVPMVVGQDGVGASEQWVLEEVVVTAQKREEKLIDVPISIVAIDESTIKNSGIQTINDLSFLVPNLSVQEYSDGEQLITIRGIGNGQGSSPLIGVYLDEIPLSINNSLKVNLEAVDVERLEVLRGPQGTLYGQGSVGGTIRFITNSPSFDGFESELGVSVYNTVGGDPSEELRTIINVPLVDDTLAVRFAGTYKNRGGWIDQPAIKKNDVNDNQSRNSRIKVLFNMSEKLTASATAVQYRNDAGGRNEVNIGAMADSNYRVTPVNGESLASTGVLSKYDLYNITLDYELSFGLFTSSSSKFDVYNKTVSASAAYDLVPPLGMLDNHLTDFVQQASGFAQEIRLTDRDINDSLGWTVGLFYSDSEEDFVLGTSGFYLDGDPFFGPGSISTGYSEVQTSKSSAIFGNITYDISNRVTIALGTRYFEDDRTFRSPPLELQNSKFDNLSSKISILYAVTGQSNLYFSISEGFRSGGFNAGVDTTYDPESVLSYEFGMKGVLLDGKVSADAAVFYSKYSDYQAQQFDPEVNFNVFQNPGEAEVQGVEWAMKIRVIESMSLGFNGNVTEAEFTNIKEGANTYRVGDYLNGIPNYSYSFNADFDFNWTPLISGFARIDYSTQGGNHVTLRGGGLVDEVLESSVIHMFNVQVGAQWKNFTVRLFGRNMNNELRETNASISSVKAQNRPRSIGVDLDYRF